MIHIRVDMWPGGDESKKYNLFDMTVTRLQNWGNRSDYRANLFRKPGKKGDWPNVRMDQPIRTGIVPQHAGKTTHTSHLMLKAILAIYPKFRRSAE